MKIFFFFVISFISQNVCSMGDTGLLSRSQRGAEEAKVLNDMGETSSRINLFSDEQGYQDQQMMEEEQQLTEEYVEEVRRKEKENEIINEKQIPQEKIHMH